MTSESTGYHSPCREDVVPALISIPSCVNATTYGNLFPSCTRPLSVRTAGLNPGGAQLPVTGSDTRTRTARAGRYLTCRGTCCPLPVTLFHVPASVGSHVTRPGMTQAPCRKHEPGGVVTGPG